MRIIAGKHKGRRIELGKDIPETIRPTSDFAREAIFNILIHGKNGLNGHTFTGKDVLDVYSGTGALGLEALSRGARSVTFIDNARDALAIARHNAQRMNESEVDFFQADATRLGKARKAYSLIFLDPPYFSKLLAPTLNSLREGGWIEADGILVIEHDNKETVEVPPAFAIVDERRYGRATIKLLKLS
jgi:16S rRNA (guanine966-N2)-methyltransferase